MKLEQSVLDKFNDKVKSLHKQAQASGALSGEENEVELARAIITIAAEYFEPKTEEGQETLENLRNFI